MEISKNILYILVEGKEWSFIERAIQELIYANILPQINYDVIEVGGSGNFNAIANWQSSICNELVECLRFRFRQNYERLKLDKPQNQIFSLEEIEIWFKEQIHIKCGESQTKIQALETILNNKLQEITWQSWFHDPMVLDINQAKRLFQGRQVLKHLFDQAKKYLSIQHLNYDIFIEKMLLPEIEKNINSAILHDIGLMLNVYFQQAAKFTEIE